jgi:peptidoglycan hydrolase-like protein with peptidoglycan-binding domain
MNSGPKLTIGAQGADVRRAQTIFVMIKTLGFEQIDGIFGTATKNAVIDFQESEGLTADGVIGDLTWGKMPADPNTPVLKRGSTGTAVTGLQKGLLKFGGAGSPTDPGPADGSFGPRTEAAVKSYQTQHALASDGVVGPRTWWAPAGAAGATLASLSELTTA